MIHQQKLFLPQNLSTVFFFFHFIVVSLKSF
uniref:Uncharacterized protein n=1 Tax=Anguilla anguilla TaxID=7936 RepID=A0A0E9UCX7_ANGAN